MRFFDDAWRLTESNADNNGISLIQDVSNQTVETWFQNFRSQTAVEEEVQKCPAERHVVNDVVACTIDATSFTVSIAKLPEK